jgi:hypothetical protein
MFSHATFNKWIIAAVKTTDLKTVQAILDGVTRIGIPLLLETFMEVCKSGDPAIVTAVLNSNKVRFKSPIRMKEPRYALEAAIICGHSSVLSAVLTAGENANGPQNTSQFFIKPLHLAIKRYDYTAVKLLLKWGAIIQTTKNKLTEDTMSLALGTNIEEIYNLVRKAKIKQDGGKVPRYLEAKRRGQVWT